MKKLILVFSFLILTVTASGQLKEIFRDDFNDNHNKWKFYDGDEFFVGIVKGKLHFEKFDKNKVNNGCLWYIKKIPDFDTMNDFSIAFEAKLIKANDVYKAMEIMWGTNRDPKDSLSNFYQVEIRTTGEIKLNHFHKGWAYLFTAGMTDLTTGRPITFNAYKPNNYEICQKDGHCLIYVNKHLIMNEEINAIYGNMIGNTQCLRSSWDMDDLVIKQ